MQPATAITLGSASSSSARLLRSAQLEIRKHLNGFLRTPLVSAACVPRRVDDYLELLDAVWSVREVRARISRIEPEAGGAISLWLVPNENWRSFRPGQFVQLAVRIDGVRYVRCFSLSSAPRDRRLRLTMRPLPGGRVCQWAADGAKLGEVVELSQAMGDFVLPDPLPRKLLFISGGSGITPIMSMLLHLLGGDRACEITALHYARREPIFGAELDALSRVHERFRYVPRLTQRPGQPAAAIGLRFSREELEAHAPDWAERETFVCGPAGLQRAVRELYARRAADARLHVEHFVAARPQLPDADVPVRCRLVFATSGRIVEGDGSASLLEQAERAGLRPEHGCRMGVCHSCKCKKVSGVVRNDLTGALSSESGEEIRLCVTLSELGPNHMLGAIHDYCTRLMQMSLECQPEVRQGWLSLLSRLSDPQQFAALPDYVRQLYRGGALFALGIVETWHDGDDALARAQELESLGLRIYDRAANQIRMLYHAGRGELDQAEHYRRRMELHAIQTGSAWQVEVTVPLTSSVVYAVLGDVVSLKRTTEQIEQLAARYPVVSLQRTARSARATYLLWCGNSDEAAAIYREVLAEVPPRAFVGWARAVGFLADAYNRQSRHHEALRACDAALQHVRAEDRRYVRMFLWLELQHAIALAGVGRVDEARVSLLHLLEQHTPTP